VLALGFGLYKLTRSRLRVVPGTPTSELVVAGTLIVLDYVALGGGEDGTTSESMRLMAVDARTGERLAVELTDHKACWPGGERVWCRDQYEQLHLLDPRTLATVAQARTLIAAAGLAEPTDRHQILGDAVLLTLADGRGAHISPSTLEVTSVETVQHGFRLRSEPSCETTEAAPFNELSLVLRGSGTRIALTTDPPPPAESPTPTPIGPALTFLAGKFLVTTPQLPLVLHDATTKGPAQITRVEGIATQRWTTTLSGSCRHARIVGDTLVIATSDRTRRAFGLDVETGAVAWILEFSAW
jgi:hypothetical protein